MSRVGTGRRNRIWSDRPTDDGAGSLHECRPGPATRDRALIASPAAAAAAAAAARDVKLSAPDRSRVHRAVPSILFVVYSGRILYSY